MYVTDWKSPIGWLRIVASDTGVRSITPIAKPGVSDTSPIIDQCVRQLEEYVSGSRVSFDLPLDHEGTPFQQKVWKAARLIPHGETRTYGELAVSVKSPGASRAVGIALGKNPIPIVVPCHRIVPSAGGIGGFAWGREKKEWLLELERS